jgi:uncharacterized YigZ family protein
LQTLAGPATFSEEIRKSRFIGSAARADSIEQAREFIRSNSLVDANHNCWAYQIDEDYRFSDDGEPASTAGRPIYAALQGMGLDHVVVLVSRYFGGTKLGAGGLVRAYGGCAAKCLKLAPVIEVLPRCEVLIEIQFDQLGTVYQLLERFDATRISEDYRSDGVLLVIELAVREQEALAKALGNATRGTARLRTVQESP